MADGAGPVTQTFTVPAGSTSMYFKYTKGSWDSEVIYQIKNPNGNTLANVVASDVKSNGEIKLDLCNE